MRPPITSCAPVQSTPTTLANTRKMPPAVSSARALRRVARGRESALDRVGEARARRRLAGEGLQRAHRADRLGRVGRSVGQRVLRRAGARTHRTAEAHQRQYDERNRDQHHRREPRAGHHHHRDRANEQHDVAERDRGGGADGGLDLGRVGGKPRNQLAGSRGIEEDGRQREDVGEHRIAQVRHHALAERGHQVVAKRARAREHGGDDHEHRRNTGRYSRPAPGQSRSRSCAGPRAEPQESLPPRRVEPPAPPRSARGSATRRARVSSMAAGVQRAVRPVAGQARLVSQATL